MIDNSLFENYKSSLQQKYNAVCFDIDGTLTEENSKKIDSRAIEMIADLLKRKIPVVFITGRGITGLNDLKKDIYDTLKKDYNINQSEFRRMYILTNDGARLFYTNNEDNNIFMNNIYISSEESFQELAKLNNIIEESIKSQLSSDLYDITYSNDEVTNKIVNIRIVLKTSDKMVSNEVYDMINGIIEKNEFNKIYVSRGIYTDKVVLQIGTTKKDTAIEKAEEIIGVPQKSMIRIGDCGDIRGNDYSMLDCEQGYSVDKTSNKLEACFPIFNDDGVILKGVDATLYLIKKAKILPTICLESAKKSDYKINYSNVEKRMVLGRNKMLSYFNDLINKKFDVIGGIYDLFDKYSGSIKIPMYEWNLIETSPLKELFMSSKDGKLLYSIRDNNNYLLRGSSTYYYFLANREIHEGKDIATKENVICWYQNYLEFFEKALIAIEQTEDFTNQENKKMILGLLDNIRNVLLVIINHKLYSEYLDKNIILNLNDNKEYNDLYKLLLIVEKMMIGLVFEKSYKLSKSKLHAVIETVYLRMNCEFNSITESLENKNYSKEYRAYREIDNFAENYITLYLNNDKNDHIDDFGVCGLSYGGIELPVLYKAINDKIQDILIIKFSEKTTGYRNKQLIDLRRFDIRAESELLGLEQVKNKQIVLLDDNVLTGKTLQIATNILYDYDIDVKNICVVRYPGINRVDQMFMKGHTAVDYKLFFNHITGLCFNSPYSWRDENELDEYEDSLGVFDLNRKKIIECLIKNHDYNEFSEVANYKVKKISRSN